MVGDVHQLPAVGPGNVLKDLMDSGVVPVARLTQIYRQARESLIVVNAHRINQGAFPDLAGFEDGRDFVYVGRQEPEDIKAALLELVCDELPERYGFDPVRTSRSSPPCTEARWACKTSITSCSSA